MTSWKIGRSDDTGHVTTWCYLAKAECNGHSLEDEFETKPLLDSGPQPSRLLPIFLPGWPVGIQLYHISDAGHLACGLAQSVCVTTSVKLRHRESLKFLRFRIFQVSDPVLPALAHLRLSTLNVRAVMKQHLHFLHWLFAEKCQEEAWKSSKLQPEGHPFFQNRNQNLSPEDLTSQQPACLPVCSLAGPREREEKAVGVEENKDGLKENKTF